MESNNNNNNNEENEKLLLSYNKIQQQQQYGSIVDEKDKNNNNNNKKINIKNNNCLLNIYDIENDIDIDNSNFRYLQIIATTTNVLLGLSIFSMPWAFKEAGIIFGSILVIITSLLSFETVKILIITQNIEFNKTGIVRNYPELASIALNNNNINVIVKIATIVSCTGGCVGSLIFFCELISQLFDITMEFTIFIAFIPLIILSIYKSRKELAKLALFTTFTVIISILTILYNGLIINKENLNNHFQPEKFSKYGFESTGAFTFLFTIHYCVLLVSSERLNEISKSRYYNNLKLNESSSLYLNNNNIYYDNLFLINPIAISYMIATSLVLLMGIPIVFYYGEVDYVLNSEGKVGHGCNYRLCQNILMNVPVGSMK
jgi:hypothetical protein